MCCVHSLQVWCSSHSLTISAMITAPVPNSLLSGLVAVSVVFRVTIGKRLHERQWSASFGLWPSPFRVGICHQGKSTSEGELFSTCRLLLSGPQVLCAGLGQHFGGDLGTLGAKELRFLKLGRSLG